MYEAIGTFIYAGGFTLGMQEHLNVLAHFETTDFGVNTFQANNPEIPVYVGKNGWQINQFFGVPVIYCNPPCAPWSAAGISYKNRDRSYRTRDPRMEDTLMALSLLEKLRPMIWVWESVTRAYTTNNQFMKKVVDKILSLGYAVTHVLHDAKTMGLPQQRRRVLTVAHKIFIPWKVPSHRMVTVSETIDLIEPDWRYPLSERYSYILPHVLEGESLCQVWNKLKLGKPAVGYLLCRVWKNKPSHVVTGRPRLFHYIEDRFLANSELAVLCGYPSNYIWTTEKMERVKEIGLGVTSPVGRWLSRLLVCALDHNEPIMPSVWLVDFRTGMAFDDFKCKNVIKQIRIEENNHAV